MADWLQHKLGDCLTLMSGGTPSKARNDYWGGDIPWVSCKDMKVSRIYDAEDHLTALGAESGTRLVPKDTILFVVRGMILARDFPVAMTKREVAFNQDLKAVRPADFIDTEFLFHWFRANTYEILGRADEAGHGTKRLQTDRLLALPISVPPMPEQRRIAGILSAYDELIENSQRRIRLLESMARALYLEWFVHFRFPGGRAEAGAKAGGHESHPRVASPLGDIPQGWAVRPLSSIVKVTHGYAFQGSSFSDEPTSRVLITPGNFKIGGGIKSDKLRFYKEDAPLESAYVFEPMDLMLTMTDLSKAGDTLGYPAFVPRLNGLLFLHNQRIGKVVPVGRAFPKHFLYFLFCDERYRHHIVGGATGTSVKHTSPSRILDYAAAMPNDGKLIQAFEKFAQPVFGQISTLIEVLHNLRRTRNHLLPRLLSSQVNLEGCDG